MGARLISFTALGGLSLVCLVPSSSPTANQIRPEATGNHVTLRAVPICAESIQDQSSADCLLASSIPSPGLLFPPPHDGGTGNSSSGNEAFVGGGKNNEASGSFATVGGGYANTSSSLNTTVAGGQNNLADGYGATVAGGSVNHAGGYSGASVGGGAHNEAMGSHATIPGGFGNVALGDFSLAAGRGAFVNQEGSFVWADSQGSTRSASANDQFNVYAGGGTRIFSSSTGSSGVLLAAGAGSWSAVSDRASKENVRAVDTREVLERLSRIPVSSWNYKTQEDGIRHLGPMAQDFHAAFGLGAGEATIDTIDADGVALAAIQGLNDKLAERDAGLRAELASKDAELAELRQELELLREALEALTSE